MRVMLIAGRAGNGTCGAGDHTLFLAAQLARDLQVDLVYRRGPPPLPDYEPALEGKTDLFLRPLSGFGSEKLGELSALIKYLQPDIVHVHYPATEYRSSVLPLLLALQRGRLRKARLVVTLHEFAASHFLRRSASRLLARRAHAGIVPPFQGF